LLRAFSLASLSHYSEIKVNNKMEALLAVVNLTFSKLESEAAAQRMSSILSFFFK